MDIKVELIKRYCYIYENAKYILAPYIEQYKFNDKKRNKKLKFEKKFNSMIIDIKQLPHELLMNLESFLLSDVPYNESKLYMELEMKKIDNTFLTTVDRGLDLLKQYNDSVYSPYLKLNLDAWEVFSKVRHFIDSQKLDTYGRVDKLHAMDEYFKIARYTNDGKVWTSGYELNIVDAHKNYENLSFANYNAPAYPRDNNDSGLDSTDFIRYLTNPSNMNEGNKSILTETDKQRIYLRYHDELPWNKTRVCEKEEEYVLDLKSPRLVRPKHTSPCGEKFYVKEEEIFMDPDDSVHPYYQLCPHCGYIVNIRKETLPDSIKQRIEARCEKDPNLFRKMYLYSELFALEKDTPNNGKRLLKTRKSDR
mgnify:CR=1 FL=1